MTLKNNIPLEPIQDNLAINYLSPNVLWIGQAPQPNTKITVNIDLSCHSDILIDHVKMLIVRYALEPQFVYHQKHDAPVLQAQLNAWQQKHTLEKYTIDVIEHMPDQLDANIVAMLISKEALASELRLKNVNQSILAVIY